jgi:hypothetical protein
VLLLFPWLLCCRRRFRDMQFRQVWTESEKDRRTSERSQSRRFDAPPLIPVNLNQRTSSARRGISERCQKRTCPLFDHLIGAGEQCIRQSQAKLFSRFLIHD